MTMRYTKLGRTGLLVSEICFGTMTFGSNGSLSEAIGALGQKDADELVKRSWDAGVTFFDTADVYAGGMSETIFGQSLRNLGLPRDEVIVATKVYGRVTPPARAASWSWRGSHLPLRRGSSASWHASRPQAVTLAIRSCALVGCSDQEQTPMRCMTRAA